MRVPVNSGLTTLCICPSFYNLEHRVFCSYGYGIILNMKLFESIKSERQFSRISSTRLKMPMNTVSEIAVFSRQYINNNIE